jgi:hypothetical protein
VFLFLAIAINLARPVARFHHPAIAVGILADPVGLVGLCSALLRPVDLAGPMTRLHNAAVIIGIFADIAPACLRRHARLLRLWVLGRHGELLSLSE